MHGCADAAARRPVAPKTARPPRGRTGRRRERKPMDGSVMAVSRSATHTLIRTNQDSIRFLTGLGVEGDAHLGETIKHQSVLMTATLSRDGRGKLIRRAGIMGIVLAGGEVRPGDPSCRRGRTDRSSRFETNRTPGSGPSNLPCARSGFERRHGAHWNRFSRTSHAHSPLSMARPDPAAGRSGLPSPLVLFLGPVFRVGCRSRRARCRIWSPC